MIGRYIQLLPHCQMCVILNAPLVVFISTVANLIEKDNVICR